MKLSPKQAPLYGGCVLTVQLDEEDEEDDGRHTAAPEAEFYLLFAGSNQRHVSSTVRAGRVTLQAVCPAHDECEQVLVTLCLARPDGPVDTHSQQNFCYVQDLALDMAHFLLDTNSPQDAMLLADNQIPSKECERLDQNLALALKYLTQPQRRKCLDAASDVVRNADGPSGSVAGVHVDCAGPRSSLLHVAAGHGLKTVATFLLQQPGGRDALRWTDARGHTPASLAESRGHAQMLELFSRYECPGGPAAEATQRQRVEDGSVFQHHSALDTFTLTRERHGDDGDACLQQDVQELRRRVRSHRVKLEDRTSLSNGGQEGGLAGGLAEEPTRPPRDDSSVHTLVSGQEASREQKNAAAAKPHVGRGRKNKRKPNKNAKHATDSPGSSGKNPPGSVQGAPKTTGSGGQPAMDPVEALTPAVLADPSRSATEDDALSASAPGGDGNRKAVAMVTSAVVEKQEAEKWEVEQLIPDAEQRRPDGDGASGRPVNMGQEQSQNPRDGQTLAEESRQADSTHPSPTPGPANSPEPQRKPRSDETRWRQNDRADPRPANSLTVWYEHDMEDKRASEKPEVGTEECGLISTLVCGTSAPQLSGQRRRSPSPGPSRPHAAGPSPAPSHGLRSQRQEVRGSRPEEEVGAGWKEGEAQEPLGCEGEDKGAKSRKKKRKKKGRKGGAEAGLDSSLEPENFAGETEAEDKAAWATVQESPAEGDVVMRLPGQAEAGGSAAPLASSQRVLSRGVDDPAPQPDLGGAGEQEMDAESEETFEVETIEDSMDPGAQWSDASADLIQVDVIQVDVLLSSQPDTMFQLKDILSADTETLTRSENPEERRTDGPATPDSSSDEKLDWSLLEESPITNLTAGTSSEDASDTFPTEQTVFTEDSLAEEFPERNTPRLVVGSLEERPLESSENPPPRSDCETKPRDWSPEMKEPRDGSLETTAGLGDGPDVEVSKDDVEETHIGVSAGDEETGTEPLGDGDQEVQDKKRSQELVAATAVAVVTVAIASAVAHLEIRQRLLAEDASSTPRSVSDGVASHDSTRLTDGSLRPPADERTRHLLIEPAVEPEPGAASVSEVETSHGPAAVVVSLSDTLCYRADEERVEQPERQLPCPVVDTGQQDARDEGTPSAGGAALDAFTEEREQLAGVSVQTSPRNIIFSSPHACGGLTSPAPDTGSTPAAGVQTSRSEAADPELAVDDPVQVGDRTASTMMESGGEDAVDGWREREERKNSEERETDTITADPSSSLRNFLQHRGHPDNSDALMIQRERDVFYPVQSCPEEKSCSDVKAATDVRVRCPEVVFEDLKESSDLDDGVFKKPRDPDSCCPGDETRGVRVSWPSTDGSSVQSSSERYSWRSEEAGEVETEVGEEEEKKDQLPDNPVSSAILRACIRSLSPVRRHSWEPNKNSSAAEMDLVPHSSVRSSPEDTKRVKTSLHRRSMSWCPSDLSRPGQEQIDNRSYSLEGLEVDRRPEVTSRVPEHLEDLTAGPHLDGHERVSLTEEGQDGSGGQLSHPVVTMTTSCPTSFHPQPLTKSVSMVAISHRDSDVMSGFTKRRISFSLSISPLLPRQRPTLSGGRVWSDDDDEEEEGGRGGSYSSASLEYSISEEDPGPLRSDAEVKGGPRISRTFSYLRNKMTKKGKEKERRREGEREIKEEKRKSNGHQFVPVAPSPQASCQHCSKSLQHKETFACNGCGVHVHKSCRENLSACCANKSKTLTATDAAAGSAANMRSKSTSSASSVSSTSSSSSRERWSSTVTSPEEQILPVFPRKPSNIFNTHSNLSKSISTSNIAGLDEVPLKGLKFLSQSSDSLHQGSKVNASTESLTDEGTEMMDNQLMGDFDLDSKDLEGDSWSATVDKKFLKTLKKDEIKRQDVIHEFYQTEFHHVRTLKIMMEVYYKGIQKELQLDSLTLDKIFPVLDDLLDTHTRFLTLLLRQKRAACTDAHDGNNYLICCVGDVLVSQFSGCGADRMKTVYGKFCSRHNEAVNVYKELHAKDKRFQAFIKKIMSSSIVRRLSIPECILLVTQRITKYPVLIQRILQHTRDSDEDFQGVSEALRCVKELITAVDSKVNEHEKKRRLRDVHSRTDSKSIMRMKSGQMFAKQDLIRGRKLLHDGALQLKNSTGRLKDVHAMLLSDVLVFLQEKDQKFVFAALDQRSTVVSLQNLIVREVANEERGLFLISAGTEKPEMVEVLASSKDERNTWRGVIQDAMHCMEKDEDEGVPSETEEDRRQQENRAKEIRELLRVKDEQIISLLEEKVHIFRDLSDGGPGAEDAPLRDRMLFRATADDVTKGEPIIKDALSEVETLHTLVNTGLGGSGCSVPVGLTGGGVGPVCLPRRAETFGGFDSHQMNINKNGEKEEGEEALDLRRTESDSVLKKGATASLQMLLKRNKEQVQMSVTRLHSLLISLQAVVVQQDSFVEEQRQALNERLAATSSRHSSSSSLSSSSSRPSSLIEQEKHRSLERQRQEAASLQKQQAAHQEERRRREKEWDQRERSLAEREERVQEEEEDTSRRSQELQVEKEGLQVKKDEYQRDLERLREAQRRLEKDKEALRREEGEQLQRYQRTPSSTSEESLRFQSSGSLELDSREELSKEVELSSSAPGKEPFIRIGSKRMGKNFNPFSSKTSDKEAQLPSRLLKLTKPKDKKEKKKKKGEEPGPGDSLPATSEAQNNSDIFFC